MISTGRSAYLAHLLIWTLPVLGAQLFGLWRIYHGRLRSLSAAVFPPVLVVTLWLSAADHFAIAAGIWRFAPGKILGITVAQVPIEEVFFFLITNLLIACGLALLSSPRLGLQGAGR